MKRFLAAAILWIVFSGASPAADRSFGDSITDGSGADAPTSTNGYIPKLGVLLGTTFTNYAHGGDMVNDQTPKILGVPTFAAGDRTVIMLGVNDQRIYGVNPTKQSYFRDGLRNLIGWAALGTKQTARSVAGETGSWGNTGIQGIGRSSTSVGSTKTFTVSGVSVYVALIMVDSAGAAGSYEIKVDGVSKGTFSASAPGISSYNGYPYSDRLHRFDGLASGSHTVVVTMTGPSNLYVEWAAGSDQAVKPKVYVGNVIRPYPSYQWGGSLANIQAYNADIAQIVSDFRADGLDVTLVDVFSALNDTTDLNAIDGLHPSQQGHDKLAQTFYAAMSGGPPPSCPPGQIGTPPNCTTPPPSLTFTAAPVYRRLNNGVPDGTFWIDDGTARKQVATQP